MRDVPAAMAEAIEGGATTLCRIWTLTRRDGAVFGFTDHDRDLVVGGVAHLARTGLEAAEASRELGFAVGGGEVAGALVSAGITDDVILAGLYDGAAVETRLVDWSAPGGTFLLDRATIGEIRRADGGFVAELRGPMHRFDEERGRLFRATCSADLGDARCGVDMNAGGRTASGIVTTTDGALSFTSGDFAGVPSGRFTAGRLVFEGGMNEGFAVEVKRHEAGGSEARFELWQRAPRLIAPGDAFTVSAGCDKHFSTCRDVFANSANFRGFPHMPGNDFVMRIARPGEIDADGSSLVA